MLYIEGEDWTTLIDLNGFEYESGLEGPFTNVPSRFLIQKRDTDSMKISIFAEKIQYVTNSDSCMNYYLPTIQEARDKSELIVSTMGKDFFVSDVKENDNHILSWEVSVNFPDMKGKIKNLDHYKYYEGYCFDFHISQTDYQGDDTAFYNIIDSIEFINSAPSKDAEDVYTIK